ncbi:MAG: hypothetical protein AB9860_06040 [Methanomassiliicoccales archaeon]
MFGGKRVDRVRDAQRIREIQDLLREIAGNVDDNDKEMAQVKAMMKARAPPAPPKVTPPEPAPAQPVTERPRAVPPPYQPPTRAPTPEQPWNPPQTPPPVPQAPPAREKPLFCIHCGSRLPTDGFGCSVCASRNTRICPNCGTRVNVSAVSCPICRRVMPPVVPYQRH